VDTCASCDAFGKSFFAAADPLMSHCSAWSGCDAAH
jgi:hypothetical protein